MQTPYRIPDFQDRILNGKSKRERAKVLAEFAIQTGLCSDNPDLWHLVHKDFIEPVENPKP